MLRHNDTNKIRLKLHESSLIIDQISKYWHLNKFHAILAVAQQQQQQQKTDARIQLDAMINDAESNQNDSFFVVETKQMQKKKCRNC